MYYLIHLKCGKVVKVSTWSEKEGRDAAFDFYNKSERQDKPWDEVQKFENKLDEYW